MGNDNNGTHRVINKRHIISHGAAPTEVWEVGDVVTPEPEWVESHPDRFEPIEATDETESGSGADETTDDSPADATESGSDADGSDLFDPTEATVAEVREWAGDQTDPDLVAEVLGRERDGEERSTAVDALDSRVNALENNDDEEGDDE